ncbi:MAG: radical SAM protein [Ignavibacteriae bacterium]|nr:MAG: radical SAM protein [Ignavibacteriota bacterium]
MQDSDTLKINEIFYSIQGESTLMGRPCVFVRLTYCNLRCSYCDTEYAFYEGKEMTLDEIMAEIEQYNCKLVEITGGEPLIQLNVHKLMKELSDKDYLVMIETAGSLSIKTLDKRVKIIMDLKTPSSGMMDKNLYENIQYLKRIDEVKFVIGNRKDYDWSVEKIKEYDLLNKVTVLMSPVFNKIPNVDIAKWILDDRINVRFQLQMHKYIWDPLARGV